MQFLHSTTHIGTAILMEQSGMPLIAADSMQHNAAAAYFVPAASQGVEQQLHQEARSPDILTRQGFHIGVGPPGMQAVCHITSTGEACQTQPLRHETRFAQQFSVAPGGCCMPLTACCMLPVACCIPPAHAAGSPTAP